MAEMPAPSAQSLINTLPDGTERFSPVSLVADSSQAASRSDFVANLAVESVFSELDVRAACSLRASVVDVRASGRGAVAWMAHIALERR